MYSGLVLSRCFIDIRGVFFVFFYVIFIIVFLRGIVSILYFIDEEIEIEGGSDLLKFT